MKRDRTCLSNSKLKSVGRRVSGRSVRCILFGVVALAMLTCLLVGGLVLNREIGYHTLRHEKLSQLENSTHGYDASYVMLSDTTPEEAAALAKRLGASLRMAKGSSFAVLSLPEGVTVEQVFADKQNNAYLSRMYANYYVQLGRMDGVVPEGDISKEPYFDYQTTLMYTGLEDAHTKTKGEGVTIAIIDSGIAYDHEDLGHISEKSYNASTQTPVKQENGSCDWSVIADTDGHGTQVAGVIGAQLNGIGIGGIAPEAEILFVKTATDEKGNMLLSDAIAAVEYVINQPEVDVLNMSWGTTEDVGYLTTLLELAESKGIVCVAAAGNSGVSTPTYPAVLPTVIGVGALDINDWSEAYYSNYGDNADIMAPGTVYTTHLDGYALSEGTSFASPIVAASVALYRSLYGDVSPETVREILYAFTYDAGARGKDIYCGYGALHISNFIKDRDVTPVELTDYKVSTAYEIYKGTLPVVRYDAQEIYAFEYDQNMRPAQEIGKSVEIRVNGWEAQDFFGDYWSMGNGRFMYDTTVCQKPVLPDVSTLYDSLEYSFEVKEGGTYELVFVVAGQTGESERGFAFSVDDGTVYQINCTNENGIQSGAKHEYSVSDLESDPWSCYQPSYYHNVKVELTPGKHTLQFYPLVEDSQGNRCTGDGHAVDFMGFYVQSYLTEEQLAQYEYPGMRPARPLVATGLEFLSNLDGTCELSGIGTYQGRRVILPEKSPEGDKVISISSRAFADTDIVSVVIPNTVSEIEYGAFENCTALESVTFRHETQDALDMGGNVFKGCTSLTGISLHMQITDIGFSAFYGCTALKSVTLSDSITSIGTNAFCGCASLKTITLPKNLKELTGFEECVSLEEIELPEGLISLGGFRGCTALKRIAMPSTVTTVGSAAFMDCTALTQVIFSDAVTSVDYSAFAGCTSLESISFPEGLTALPVDVLGGCTSLKQVTIPSTVTTIGQNAFKGCSALQEVMIPESVTTIEFEAFYNCTALNCVYIYSKAIADKIQIDSSAGYLPGYAQVLVLPADVSLTSTGINYLQKELPNWEDVLINGKEMRSMSRHAHAWQDHQVAAVKCQTDGFSGKLCSVCALQSGVRVSCHAWEEIKLAQLCHFGTRCADCLTQSDVDVVRHDHAFTSTQKPTCVLDGFDLYTCTVCHDQRKDTIPCDGHVWTDTHTCSTCANAIPIANTYDVSAKGDGSLTATIYELLKGKKVVMEIGGTGDMRVWRTYYNGVWSAPYNGQIVGVVIGEGATSISESAFLDEKQLVFAKLPKSLKTIETSAFSGCSALKEIALPAGLTSLGEYAFRNCTSLTSFEVPTGITVLPRSMLEGCESITSITLHNKITAIGDYALFNCSAMTELVLPEGVISLGEYALSANKSLARLTLPSTLTAIGRGAFYNCPQLASVTIPQAVTEIGESAFGRCTALKTLTFPENVQVIPASVCVDCTALESVTFSQNVHTLGQEAFGGCSSLKTFTYPKALTDVGRDVLRGCSALTTIYYEAITLEFADHLQLGQNAGAGNEDLTVRVGSQVEKIPSGFFIGINVKTLEFEQGSVCKQIGASAFKNCANLDTVVLPVGLTLIDSSAFQNCTALETVVFPGTLTTIGQSAFGNCNALREVYLPASLECIESQAFADCDNLQVLSIPTNGLTLKTNYVFHNTQSIKTVYLSDFSLIFGSGTSSAGNFVNVLSNITTLLIPQDLATEQEYAPSSFQSTDVVTQYGMTYMAYSRCVHQWVEKNTSAVACVSDGLHGKECSLCGLWSGERTDRHNWQSKASSHVCYPLNVCKDCGKVQAIYGVKHTYPDAKEHTVTCTVNGYLEYTCTLCEHVEQVVTQKAQGHVYHASKVCPTCQQALPICYQGSIGKDAESDVTATLYTLLDGKKYVLVASGNGYMKDWYSTIELPEQLQEKRSAITHLIVEEGVKNVGSYLMEYAKKLTNVSLPASLEQIGDHAFQNCKSLAEINLPAALISIGDNAFEGCTSLASVEFPETLLSIGSYAFSGCSSLQSITLPINLQTIDYNAFGLCTGIRIVYVHSQKVLGTIMMDSAAGCLPEYVQVFAIDASLTNVPDYIKNTFATEQGTVTYKGTGYAVYSKHAHQWQEYTQQPVACVSDGFTGKMCAECLLGDGEVISCHAWKEQVHPTECKAVKVCADCSARGQEYVLHAFATEKVVAPTCESGGYTLHKCTKCNEQKTDGQLAALGHDHSQVKQAVPVTCVQAGYTVYKCVRCESTETRDYTDALGHDHSRILQIIEPTCQDSGHTVYKCVRCDSTETRDYKSSLGHNYSLMQEVIEPTCQDSGHTVYKCVRCDATETRGYQPSLGHDHSKVLQLVPATCNAGGYTVYQCVRCDSTETRDWTSTLGHDYSKVREVIEPGCHTYGYTVYQCVRCDSTETRDRVPAIGHDYSVVQKVVETTCTTGGYTVYQCVRCTATEIRDRETAYGHDYSEVVKKVEPTCTAEGYTVYKCVYCTLTQTRDRVAALQHDYSVVKETVAPTCNSAGYVIYQCIRCDATKRETLAPLPDHEYVIAETVEPTCTTSGYSLYQCKYCDRTEHRDAIPALGHDHSVLKEDVAPTCLTDGYKLYQCVRCDSTQVKDPISALDHDFSETVTATEATCQEGGYTTYKCVRCDRTEIRDQVPALGHDCTIAEQVIDPTCANEGYTLYRCVRCEFTQKKDMVPALAHSYTVTVTVVPPTCQAQGYTVYRCEWCQATQNGSVTAAAEHEYTVKQSVVAPTCTEPGYTVYKCTYCDFTEQRDQQPAKGHEYDEIKQTVEPTCIEQGYTIYKCKHCDSIEQRDIVPAKGHEYDEIKQTVEPTCTEQGYTLYTCKHCDSTEQRDIVPAKGHSFTVVKQVVTPTCTIEGYTLYQCDGCDAVQKGNIVPALPHSFTLTVSVVPPTCEENGYTVYGCEWCDTTQNGAVTTATGHKYTVVQAVVLPTCTESGYTLYKCAGCESTMIGAQMAALGHDFSQKLSTVAPSCTENGYSLYRCTRCECTEQRDVVPAKWHDVGDDLLCRVCGAQITPLETYQAGPNVTAAIYQTGNGKIFVLSGSGEMTDYSGGSSPWYVKHSSTIKRVVIGEGITTVGAYAFLNCNAMESVSLPDSLTEIRNSAFQNCSMLKEVTIKEQVTSLGNNAFMGCSSLERIVIPASVCQIGSSAFLSCNSLQIVALQNAALAETIQNFNSVGFAINYADTVMIPTSITAIPSYLVKNYPIAIDAAYLGMEYHVYSKHEHVWEIKTWITEIIPCTQAGICVQTCEQCGVEITQTVQPHTMEEVSAKDSTCSEQGYTAHQRCLHCDYTVGKTMLPIRAHTMGLWETVVRATCTQEGIRQRSCSLCEYTETRAIAMLSHKLQSHAAKAPTCIEDGWEAYETCSNCTYSTYSVIPAMGHEWGETVAAKAPTCTEQGWEAYQTCTLCGHSTFVSIPETGHTMGELVPAKAPTCTEDGWEAYSACTVCGDAEITVLPAKGHSFGAWTETVAPTCTENGEHVRACSGCQLIQTESLSATGHSWGAQVPAKQPTCTEDGWEAYTECQVCKSSTKVDIPAMGHKPVSSEHEKQAATCTEPGIMEVITACVECSLTLKHENVPVEKLGHTYSDEWTVEQEPTCQQAGTKARYCVRCNDSTDRTDIPATEHTPGEWVVDQKATEQQDGLKTRSCTGCGKVLEQQVIPATSPESQPDSEQQTSAPEKQGGCGGSIVGAYAVLMICILPACLLTARRKKGTR